MSKISKRSSVVMPTLQEYKVIAAAAKADPDAQPLTPKQLKSMVPVRALRGRQKSENAKQLVSARYSREVLAFFKSTAKVGSHVWTKCCATTSRAIHVERELKANPNGQPDLRKKPR